MGEAEWLASDDSAAMVAWVTRSSIPHLANVPPSSRKLRLFIAASMKIVLPESKLIPQVELMADDPSIPHNPLWWPTDRDAADAARCVSTVSFRLEARQQLASLLRTIIGNPWRPVTRDCPLCGGRGKTLHQRMPENNFLSEAPAVIVLPPPPVERICERCHGSGAVVGVPKAWLTHADGRVPKLAQVIYDERRWDDMPMLADALEESGCRDEVILRWCRGEEFIVATDGTYRICERCMTGFPSHPEGRHKTVCPKCGEKDALCKARGWIPRRGPSVRGDWCLDLLLGKE